MSRETQTRCILIIPARYASTRFPGKPLAPLGEATVIEHVARAALKTRAGKPVIIATDDNRIAETIARAFDEREVLVAMTSADCQTGTDRLAEVVSKQFAARDDGRTIVINVQGDEPFIDPRHVDILIDAMRADSSLEMATLCTPLSDETMRRDPNVVKVVRDKNDFALYFSRAPIPFERDAPTPAQDGRPTLSLRHLGVYAYSARWLLQMAQLPPSPLENFEKLEQLRALENGVRVKVLCVPNVIDIAIDTPADLERARQFLETTD